MIWDAVTGRETLKIECSKTMTCTGSVAFSPDGKQLAAGVDQTVQVWDAATGRETLTLKGPSWRCHERGVQPRWFAARIRQQRCGGVQPDGSRG